jgi:hypothetical protein
MRGAVEVSDLQGIRRRGIADQRAGVSYLANPFFESRITDDPAALLEWHDVCCAWAAGWLEEDAGRDMAIQGLIRVHPW